MPSESVKQEFQEFVQFATRSIERGDAGETVEDLVQQWRSDAEYAQAVADVRQGLADDAEGQAESVAQVFAEVRRQLGIAE